MDATLAVPKLAGILAGAQRNFVGAILKAAQGKAKAAPPAHRAREDARGELRLWRYVVRGAEDVGRRWMAR